MAKLQPNYNHGVFCVNFKCKYDLKTVLFFIEKKLLHNILRACDVFLLSFALSVFLRKSVLQVKREYVKVNNHLFKA